MLKNTQDARQSTGVCVTLLAFATYLATTGLGIASLRGHRVKRVWHSRLFILTIIVTIAAALLSFPGHWPRGIALIGALVPLALLPLLSVPVTKHIRRHALIALAAAPFYLAAVLLWAMPLLI